MFNKQYNNWVSKNFDGLSAHTLYQILTDFMYESLADEWVYVILYNYFRGIHTDDNTKCYECAIEYVKEYWSRPYFK